MEIIKLNSDNQGEIIKKAIAVLKSGGLVIYPTETCYGVGVDATNKKAVEKLLKYKERPEGKAISIAVANQKMAEKYVDINPTAKNLYDNFLPGPITVISKSKGKVIKDLEAENGTLGVRIPDFALINRIIEVFGKPITATSANASGRKTPYKIADIVNNISNKKKELISLIVDAGELPHHPPSTVVETTLNDFNVLRKGKLDLSSLSKKKTVKTPHQSVRDRSSWQSFIFISQSEAETQKLAGRLMSGFRNELKKKCLIFALQGELGVGKTQFAKGVGKALGIKQNITSPTFILVREYPFKLKDQNSCLAGRQAKIKTPNKILNFQFSVFSYYHIDTWRMREGKELLELGFNKMLKPGNVIVVEWLEKVKEILDKVSTYQHITMVWVEIDHVSETKREIKIFANSK